MVAARVGEVRGCAGFLVLVFFVALGVVRSAAAGVVGDVEVNRAAGATEIAIRFTTALRYLRHAPEQRGNSVVIQLGPLSGGANETVDSNRREWRRLPPGNLAGATEIVLEGAGERGYRMEIRFQRAVDFEVHPGADPLRLAVVLPDEIPSEQFSENSPVHSVQIHAGPAAEGLPKLELGDPSTGFATMMHSRSLRDHVQITSRTGAFRSR